jgi:peptidoglycan/xylan/chitin deacetylase (PgdA/CDA1 family)
MEPQGSPQGIGRREALGLGALGAAALFVAGDAVGGSPVRPPRVVARARPPAPATTVTKPPRPVPAAPAALWHKPAFQVGDIVPGAPANAIALTIDDGPHPVYTPQVLEILERYKVKATFCLIGEQIRENEKIVRMMAEEGHQVANHTWTHPLNIRRLSAARVSQEISKTYQQIVDVTGKNPRLFRSPGGNWSPTVFQQVAKHGMIPLDWDVDPRDWSRPGTGQIIHQMLRGRGGDILLCHDGGGDRTETLRALRTVLPRLKDRGLQFVTL